MEGEVGAQRSHNRHEKHMKQYISLGFVWIITMAASTFEIVVGIRNNSLTLLSDGFHNMSDVVGMGIAFWALWVCFLEYVHLFYTSILQSQVLRG